MCFQIFLERGERCRAAYVCRKRVPDFQQFFTTGPKSSRGLVGVLGLQGACVFHWVAWVTHHLHFWQNDRDLWRGYCGRGNMEMERKDSAQKVDPGEENSPAGDSNPRPITGGYESGALTTETVIPAAPYWNSTYKSTPLVCHCAYQACYMMLLCLWHTKIIRVDDYHYRWSAGSLFHWVIQ